MVAPFEPEWVVVARAGLGTLNHSELTVRALQERGQRVRGLVVGSWPQAPGEAEQQNLVDLPRVTGVPVLGQAPRGSEQPAGPHLPARGARLAAGLVGLTCPDLRDRAAG